MFDRMRIRFAVYFMLLVLILHLVGAATSIYLFHGSLQKNMDVLLIDLLTEIAPSIEIHKNQPTLSAWAETADEEKLQPRATIQVFDLQGHLLEQYGPLGVNKLAEGHLRTKIDGIPLSIRSKSQKIVREGKEYGYVQVQSSTEQEDKATLQSIYAALLVMPFIGMLVAVAGYIYAGIALKPVNKTMRLLRRFVADAGHELNTPIAIIQASLETLQAILHEKNVQEDLTDVIAKASARMNELASDLVFLARVEDPLSAYPLAPIKIKKVIEDVAADFNPLAKLENIDLQIDSIPDVEISGNVEFLKRMLSGLISNAIRYTNPGGNIHLSAIPDGKRLEISVKDTGIGIAPDSVDKIFDRFYRTDKARSRARAAGGAGLGLSIVKAVVESHKGTIGVSSKLGSGSTFTVSIPLAK